ncbi:hypothetical protein TorRG33x02_187540 [Trema orientale]|uniref:Uncharacterized protein n=1 Tax=Trema orientale TaxID=63057 RepID=A0A2P5EIW8_TREOI|nr:hypothetical protein TorRG33x02_187540 [Trema orientale]
MQCSKQSIEFWGPTRAALPPNKIFQKHGHCSATYQSPRANLVGSKASTIVLHTQHCNTCLLNFSSFQECRSALNIAPRCSSASATAHLSVCVAALRSPPLWLDVRRSLLKLRLISRPRGVHLLCLVGRALNSGVTGQVVSISLTILQNIIFFRLLDDRVIKQWFDRNFEELRKDVVGERKVLAQSKGHLLVAEDGNSGNDVNYFAVLKQLYDDDNPEY